MDFTNWSLSESAAEVAAAAHPCAEEGEKNTHSYQEREKEGQYPWESQY